jgi:hypothetical protein
VTTILKDTTPRARKQHQCCLCCEPIYVGEVHHYQTYVDGEFVSVRTCRFCAAFWGKYYDDWDRENTDTGEFLLDMENHYLQLAAPDGSWQDRRWVP